MKIKKSYMVAVTTVVQIPVTVYVEEIAHTAAQAVKQVKKGLQVAKFKNDFLEEAKISFEDAEVKEKVCFASAGRANQYHSDSECELCRSLIKGAA